MRHINENLEGNVVTSWKVAMVLKMYFISVGIMEIWPGHISVRFSERTRKHWSDSISYDKYGHLKWWALLTKQPLTCHKQHRSKFTYQINKQEPKSFIKRYAVEDHVIQHSQSITPLLYSSISRVWEYRERERESKTEACGAIRKYLWLISAYLCSKD